MARAPNKGRAGLTGTSMITIRPSKRQRKKDAKARHFSTESKIGKDAMKAKRKYERELRTRARPKPIAKSDVIENRKMRDLKAQAMESGKYLNHQ